jgi:hypothetical protein
MKITLFFLLIFSLNLRPLGYPIQPGDAKDNLKLYTKDDGMAGHSFVNWHALNKSLEHRITFTAFFKADGAHPTYWKQTMTLNQNEDKIICPAKYSGSTNSVFCTVNEAHYTPNY